MKRAPNIKRDKSNLHLYTILYMMQQSLMNFPLGDLLCIYMKRCKSKTTYKAPNMAMKALIVIMVVIRMMMMVVIVMIVVMMMVPALLLRRAANNGDDDLPSTTFRLCPKHTLLPPHPPPHILVSHLI